MLGGFPAVFMSLTGECRAVHNLLLLRWVSRRKLGQTYKAQNQAGIQNAPPPQYLCRKPGWDCGAALTAVPLLCVTAVIVGGVVGALFAAFLVMLLIYRMKKKDEGSYTLEEPKQANVTYQKPDKQEEFYA